MTEENVLPAVAKNVLYPCKKCDSDKYHRVLAHKTPTSASIECETCGSKKTYKLAKPKKATTGRKRVSAKNKIANQWAEMNEAAKGIEPTPYRISGTYKESQPIDHVKFGMGFVTQVYPHKVEVIFNDSIKELIHNKN